MQDAPRVFLWYKNTYARENYSPRRGPVPGRKAGRPPFARALLGAARRNPACDVDKMPSPNFGSYRELNPSILCNPLSHKCFCSKETLEEHLAQDAPRVFLCYKNTYAREDYREYSGSIPGRSQSSERASCLRRKRDYVAPHQATLWQKAGDQPSYREPGPFGGCNFLSHKCFCIKETLEEHLALMREQSNDKLFIWAWRSTLELSRPKKPHLLTQI